MVNIYNSTICFCAFLDLILVRYRRPAENFAQIFLKKKAPKTATEFLKHIWTWLLHQLEILFSKVTHFIRQDNRTHLHPVSFIDRISTSQRTLTVTCAEQFSSKIRWKTNFLGKSIDSADVHTWAQPPWNFDVPLASPCHHTQTPTHTPNVPPQHSLKIPKISE